MQNAKVSEKDTKRTIFQALQETQRELEKSKKHDSTNKRATLRVAQDEGILQGATSASVEDIIKSFRVDLNKGLSGFEQQILGSKELLDRVNAAIQIAERNLKEIHDITKEADTLEALMRCSEKEVIASALAREKFMVESQELEAKHKAEVKETEELTRKAQLRAAEDYTYDITQQSKKDMDSWAEMKAKREKELKTREEDSKKTLDARSDAINAVEQEFGALVAEKAGFPKVMESAVNKAVNDMKARVESSKAAALAAITSKRDAEALVAKQEISSLTVRLKEATDRALGLQIDVQNAYKEMRQVTSEAIKGAAQAKVFVTSESNHGKNT